MAFGRNNKGQLGLNNRIDKFYPTPIMSFSSHQINYIDAGLDFTACIYDREMLATWGNNKFGQLGHKTNSLYQIIVLFYDLKF